MFSPSTFIKILLSSIVAFTIGCNVNNSNSTEEPEVEILPELPPAFDDQFSMVINGESWSDYVPSSFGNSTFYFLPLAILNEISDSNDSLLQVINYKHQASVSLSGIKNYYDFVSFFDIYEELATSYPLQQGEKIEGVNSGFVYGEYVGGDDIIYYYPIESDSNFFMVETKRDEFGRRFVEGSFSATLIVDPTKRDPKYDQFRFRPDTIRIAKGQFKMELNTE